MKIALLIFIILALLFLETDKKKFKKELEEMQYYTDDEKEGYENAMQAVHELILDKDLIEDVQPVKCGRWELTDNPSFRKCSECGVWWSSAFTDSCFVNYCPRCGIKVNDRKE